MTWKWMIHRPNGRQSTTDHSDGLHGGDVGPCRKVGRNSFTASNKKKNCEENKLRLHQSKRGIAGESIFCTYNERGRQRRGGGQTMLDEGGNGVGVAEHGCVVDRRHVRVQPHIHLPGERKRDVYM